MSTATMARSDTEIQRDVLDELGWDARVRASDIGVSVSSGIVTRSLDSAIKAVKGIRAGTVNVNEIPGYRLELSPFGGIGDSGLGIKEGVTEAMKFMTTVKTYSLPW